MMTDKKDIDPDMQNKRKQKPCPSCGHTSSHTCQMSSELLTLMRQISLHLKNIDWELGGREL